MFERIHLQTIKKRINESRKFIQVILGPRQVGLGISPIANEGITRRHKRDSVC